MDHYQEVMVALSESIMKNCVKHPLTEKSRWRHIRFAITSLSRKPFIKAKKLLWNAIRKSFWLFQTPSWKNTCGALGGGLTMTSYPVGNKSLLSRKPCMQLNSYYGSVSWSHVHSFRIRHWKVRAAPLTEDWRWRYIRRYFGNRASQIKSYFGTLMISKSWSLF